MMQDAYQVIRTLAQKALLACAGNWNEAEQLMYRWLEADTMLRQQLMQAFLEFHIRHAITAEGRRQHQRAADLRREELIAGQHEQEITQTVEEFLRELPQARRDKGQTSG